MPISDQQLFQSINDIHSECSKLDKVARLAYLKGQLNKLNQMAWQYGAYLQGRVRITKEERLHAQQIIDMIKEVESESRSTEDDLRIEVLRELAMALVRGY